MERDEPEYPPMPKELLVKATVEEILLRSMFGVPTDETLIMRTEAEANYLKALEMIRMEEASKGPNATQTMDIVLLTIPEPDRTTFQRRFGLITGKVDEPEEIARELGLTPERVEEIERQVLEKLKSPEVVKFMIDFPLTES